MDPSEKTQAKPKSEQGKNLILVVLVLLVVISGAKLFLDYLDKSQQTEQLSELTAENKALSDRLDSVEVQLQLRIQELEKLGANVTELRFLQDQLIQERKSNIQRSSQEIAGLNQRINDLSSLLVQKDEEISSLQERFKALSTENEALKSTQTEMEKEVETIQLQKKELANRVAQASKLKLQAIRLSGLNARGKELSGGKPFKRKQLKGIQVIAKLSENALAEKGSRTAYLQVIGPNGLPLFDLSKGSGTFTWKGENEFFTAKQEFWFDANEQSLVFLFEKGTSFASGVYEVKVLLDQEELGSSTFQVD
uniref:hypothetical protein n=1 Tax=Algoriphagus sp. TaxID=1872435 RepID=UPI004048C852